MHIYIPGICVLWPQLVIELCMTSGGPGGLVVVMPRDFSSRVKDFGDICLRSVYRRKPLPYPNEYEGTHRSGKGGGVRARLRTRYKGFNRNIYGKHNGFEGTNQTYPRALTLTNLTKRTTFVIETRSR